MKAENGYVAVEQITGVEEMSGGLVYSSKDSSDMVVQKGKMISVAEDVAHIFTEGHVAYYNKARVVKVSIKGEIVTFIRSVDIVATEES